MWGVAIGGRFLGGHRLVAYSTSPASDSVTTWRDVKTVVQWDGQAILTKDKDRFEQSGVYLSRDLGKIDGLSEEAYNELVKELSNQKGYKGKWEGVPVYAFRLPRKVEIFLASSVQGLQVVIKMPPQKGQEGWCGNFNGNKADDDPKASAQCQDTPDWQNGQGGGCASYASFCANGAAKPGQQWMLGSRFNFPEKHCCVCGKAAEAKGTMLAEDEENWFYEARRANPLKAALLMEAGRKSSVPPSGCETMPLVEAENVCKHIRDVEIRVDCIVDVCAGGVQAAEAEDDIVIMKVLSAGVGAIKECEPIE